MTRFPRIGIVAGLARELDGFRPDLPRVARADAPFAVDEVAHGERALFLACAGIGKGAAATAATWLACRCAVDLLIVIGTAGALERRPGRVFRITHAVQSDYGAQMPHGHVPHPAGAWPIGPGAVVPIAALAITSDLPAARIATGDVFVACGAHAARLAATFSTSLIDMETAAVAQAAGLLGLPWLAFKAVTDDADEGGAADFTAHLDAAARAAGDAAARAIDLL